MAELGAALTWLPAAPPLDLDRASAAAAAAAELAKPEYQAARPSALLTALQWLIDRLTELLGLLTYFRGTGPLLVVLLIAALFVLVVLVVRGGAPRRRHKLARALDPSPVGRETAAAHRARAHAALAAQDCDTAVLEAMRALVRGLEQRGVLDERAGRTADEVSAEAGRRLPELAPRLRQTSMVFDEVVYGRRRADASDARAILAADELVQRARLRTTDSDLVSLGAITSTSTNT